MIGDVIKNVYIKDYGGFGVEVYIETDKSFYFLHVNGFTEVITPNLDGFEIDDYWKLEGIKILDAGTDGMYTLFRLSDNRFMTYDAGGDWIEFNVTASDRFEEMLNWIDNFMDKLSLEHPYLVKDWVMPPDK